MHVYRTGETVAIHLSFIDLFNFFGNKYVAIAREAKGGGKGRRQFTLGPQDTQAHKILNCVHI